jgi:methionyl-tRNA formyltransferase
MRIVILTSSLKGTAAHHLPFLLKSETIKVAMVIVNNGTVLNKRKAYIKKIKKILRIGLLGSLNGLRMRRWYGENLEKALIIKNLLNICENANIPLKFTPGIGSSITKSFLLEANADLGISLGNSYIPRSIFSIPKWGMINIHHEILPEYQNAQSVIWQLYNGSMQTGFTIHKIDEHIDTGSIIYQEKIKIDFKDTLSQTVTYTLARVYEASAEALVKVLANFNFYNSNAKSQGMGRIYTTPSLKEFTKIYRQFRRLRSSGK